MMTSPTMDKINLKDLTPSELESFISGMGKEKYRAAQVLKWLYQKGVASPEEMTNLSREFRGRLGEVARISRIAMAKVQISADSTKKILFRLEDGSHIESVIIPGRSHATLCVSTQVGCRMCCRFCLTGRCGFQRDLRPSEITDQITVIRKEMPEEVIGNIVMMGMGEPLDNYDNVLKAIRIITSDPGLAISKRRITVSTCGIPDKIRQLGIDARVNLAVSLNAADNETRSMLMPINRQFPIEQVILACRDYEMPLRRRITFEYILIEGVNASVGDAGKLARILRGLRCKVNLIAFNEHPGSGSGTGPGSGFKRPPAAAIEAFRRELVRHGYTAVLRAGKGADILAACGQLRGSLIEQA